MEYVEMSPLPACCQDCEDRARCIVAGEGEWCCDECEHLAERFIPACKAKDEE